MIRFLILTLFLPYFRLCNGNTLKGSTSQIYKDSITISTAQVMEQKGDDLLETSIHASIKNYELAYKEYSSLNCINERINVAKKLKNIFNDIGNIDKSLVYSFYLLKHYSHTQDSLHLGQIHSHIGSLYDQKSEYSLAQKHMEIALEIAFKLNSDMGISAVSNNISEVYFRQNKIDKAFESLQRAEKINMKNENFKWLSINYREYADLYHWINKYDSSIYYLTKAWTLVEKYGSKLDSIETYRKYGIYHLKANHHQESISYFQKCIDLNNSSKNLCNQSNYYVWLSEAYKANGELELALKHLEKGHELESTYHDQQQVDIAEGLKIAYQMDDLEAKLDNTILEKIRLEEESEKRNAYLTYMFVIAILLLFMGAIILIKLRKQKVTDSNLIEPLQKKNEKKYAQSNLSSDKKTDIHQSFEDLMIHSNFFLKDKISLEQVAKELEVSRSYLSQVINEKYGTNFSSVVNQFRIDLAKNYLKNPDYDKYSIKGISELVGFKSFSAFNTAFKKNTETTPASFRKASTA